MGKTHLFLLLLFVLYFCQTGVSQNYISFTKYTNGNRIVLKLGARLKLKFKNKDKVVGSLQDVTDSSLILENDTGWTEYLKDSICWYKFHSQKFLGQFTLGSSISIMTGGPFYLLLNGINGGWGKNGYFIEPRHLRTAGYIFLTGAISYGLYQLFFHKRHKPEQYHIQFVSLEGL